jgi:Putative Ig domain
MKHTFFCRRPRVGSTLIALVAGAVSCTLNVAFGDDSAHWQDKVTITGSPATQLGTEQAYSFTPSATDTSGRTLAFAISNMPPWAGFSTSTGQLSGTPSASSVGTYPNIVIGVSDGWQSATLPAFAIQVLAPLTISGSATIILTPPTENTDGTALTDLAGVIIYYGTSPSNLSQNVRVASTTQTSYTLTNLASGTWYFGGVAYTTTSVQSAMSSPVSATIP